MIGIGCGTLACHTLAVEAERRICALTGLPSLYSSDDWFAQMFAARLPVETDIVALKLRLYEDFRVEVPLIEWNGHKLISRLCAGLQYPSRYR